MANFYLLNHKKYLILFFLFISQSSSLTVAQDYALSFGGTNDYVTFGQATTELGAAIFTLEAWVKRAAGGTVMSTGLNGFDGNGGRPKIYPVLTKGMGEGDAVPNKNLNYFLGITETGFIGADFEDNATGGNHPVWGVTQLAIDVWYHMAATYDGQTWKLYLNGVLDQTLILSSAFTPQSASIQHAALATGLQSSGNPTGASGYFSGVIDEPRVWNLVRSQTDIQDNMNSEITSGTGLLGRWGLNDGSGTSASNLISGSPQGTLINNPNWVTPGFPGVGSTVLSFQEGVNDYTGTLDNFLSTLTPNNEHGLTATTFEWDQSESGNQNNPSYGLLRFDNIFGAAPDSIPSNAAIISATVEYTITSDPGDQANVNEATTAWDESTTFNSFSGDPTSQGTNIGTATGSPAGSYTIDVKSSISSWLVNPSSNRGWIFVPLGTDGTSTSSSENVTVQDRPKLTVSYIVPTAIPDPPVASAASNISHNEFKANWASSTQATSYRLDVATDNSFTNILAGYNDLDVGNTTNITVTGLNLLTTYYYRVRAVNTLGTSGSSNTISVTTTDVPDALFLDGTDTYVKIDDAGGLGFSSFTIETWFRRDGPGTSSTTGNSGVANALPLVTKGAAEGENQENRDITYYLGIDDDTDKLCADFEEGASGNNQSLNHPLIGTTIIANDVWHHAAFTYDGTTMKLYLDGNQEGTLTVSEPTSSASFSPVSIGSSLQSDGVTTRGLFDGTFDEVRIWDLVRSQTDIQSSINSQISSAQTGLVARWALDEGSGTSVLGSAGTTFNGAIVNNNYQWVAGAPFNLGNAPYEPVLGSPANGATVTDFPDLQVTVTDPNGDNVTVTFYGREIVAGSHFNLIGLPDTQYYVSSKNGGLPAMFTSQTQWIADNRVVLDIKYVAQLGDCVENGNTVEAEWQNAETSMSILENASASIFADGIPYGIAVGNHDQTPFGTPGGTAKYNEYFGISRFNGRAYYGGNFGSLNDNHYDFFSGGGMDFIVIYFEYDQSVDQAVLDWADGLLTTYSNKRAIVVTHHVLGTGNPGSFGSQGQDIYDALKDNSNLFLMLGGHVGGEGQRTDVFNNNTVHSLLSDYQGRSNGGHGLLRIMEFVPASNMINVKTYSPYTDEDETDSNSEFSLNYSMTESIEGPFNQLYSTTVSNGNTASYTWTGLNASSTYQWYVELDDQSSNPTTPIQPSVTTGQSPSSVTTGPIWSFSTDAGLPVELSSFTAHLQGSDVRLDWRTETELNNYGFEILRRTQNEEWITIGFVDGYGNTNSPKEYSFVDESPSGGTQLSYRLKQIDTDGKFEYSSIVEVSLAPNDFALYQNYPNPFNPTTKIKYTVAPPNLPEGEAYVIIKVYDVLGSEIAILVNEEKDAGTYEIEFSANGGSASGGNAWNLTSGMYIYRMQAGSFTQIKKMLILK